MRAAEHMGPTLENLVVVATPCSIRLEHNASMHELVHDIGTSVTNVKTTQAMIEFMHESMLEDEKLVGAITDGHSLGNAKLRGAAAVVSRRV